MSKCKECANYDEDRHRQCIAYNNECKADEDATHCCEFVFDEDKNYMINLKTRVDSVCLMLEKEYELYGSCSLINELYTLVMKSKKIKQIAVKNILEEVSNTIEAMIYKKQDEYGDDIPEMYAEIVDDLQDWILKRMDGE